MNDTPVGQYTVDYAGPDQRGRYVAWYRELPSLVAQGNSPEVALADLRLMVPFILAILARRGIQPQA